MPTTPLFPLPEGLELTAISQTSEELLVHVTSHRSSSPCPQCATVLATSDIRSKKCATNDTLRLFSALSLQQVDGHRTAHCAASRPVLRTDIRSSQYR